MTNYWELHFKTKGAMWKFEPSDSALQALDLFTKNNIHKILIPGVGYGRNAKCFCDAGFDVTGIEIAETAINIARENGLNFKIHHGSVTQMPFDKEMYDGIFSYALIHLLNKTERIEFLQSCYHQLKENGIMVIAVVSDQAEMCGKGRFVSFNRYEVSKGIRVFFYNDATIKKEFKPFGLVEYNDIDEPVKFENGHNPLKIKYIVCRKLQGLR